MDTTVVIDVAAHDLRADLARPLYDAECALHYARQTHVAAWIAAAATKLHQAIGVLSMANVAVTDLESMCDHSLRELYRDGRLPIPITPGALIVLDAAQCSQDRGHQCEAVLDDATAAAARFLDVVSVLPALSRCRPLADAPADLQSQTRKALLTPEVVMRIHAGDLATGDVLTLNDWRLHVIAVEHDHAVGVLTAEFDFLIHFRKDDLVDVRRHRQAA